jgi:hypothetical protein
MKVQTLAQYLQTLLKEKNKIDKKLYEHIENVTSFYNDSFKPGTINIFFSGWDYIPDDPYKFLSKSGNKELQIMAFLFAEQTQQISYRWKILTKDGIYQDGKRTLNDLPLTLDQFISDCMRAGIPLKWEQMIIDKYFNY